ncbi:hypothetical protein, partial [Burkholderia sp. LMG 13014]
MNLDQSRIGSCPAYGRILSRFVRDRGRCPGAARDAASHEPASTHLPPRQGDTMNSPASPTSPAGTVTRERRDKVL